MPPLTSIVSPSQCAAVSLGDPRKAVGAKGTHHGVPPWRLHPEACILGRQDVLQLRVHRTTSQRSRAGPVVPVVQDEGAESDLNF